MHLTPELLAEILSQRASPEALLRALLRHHLLHSAARGLPVSEVLGDLDLSSLHRLAEEVLDREHSPGSRGRGEADLLEWVDRLQPGEVAPGLLLELVGSSEESLLLGIVRRAEAEVFRDPPLALQRARLALLAAAPAAGSEARPSCSGVGLARLTLATAHRAAGDGSAAREQVREAVEDAKAASHGGLLAYAHSTRAALAADRGLPHRAVRHLEAAGALHRAASTSPALARSFLLSGRVLLRLGRGLEAEPVLREVGAHVGRALDDHLVRRWGHLYGHLLADLERGPEVRRLVEEEERASGDDRGVWGDWLLGRLARQEGDLRRAGRRLEAARAGAVVEGDRYSAGVLECELALAALLAGSPAAPELFRRAAPVLLEYDLDARLRARLLRLYGGLGPGAAPTSVAEDLQAVLRGLRCAEPRRSPAVAS